MIKIASFFMAISLCGCMANFDQFVVGDGGAEDSAVATQTADAAANDDATATTTTEVADSGASDDTTVVTTTEPTDAGVDTGMTTTTTATTAPSDSGTEATDAATTTDTGVTMPTRPDGGRPHHDAMADG